MTMISWANHQKWEQGWHGTCANMFGEEAKQITYAHRMGLVVSPDDGHWPSYDLAGRSIIDIGGGPASMLLKCRNVTRATVVDPCLYPYWVSQRYKHVGIDYIIEPAEDLELTGFDEAWIYNVLEHVHNPRKVVEAARHAAKLVRIFDWVYTTPRIGHPHTLTPSQLTEYFGHEGIVEDMNGENGCTGKAFYGVFQS